MPDHESLEIPIQYPGHRVTNPQPPSFTSAEIQDFSDDLEAIEEAERAARILEHDPDHLLASAIGEITITDIDANDYNDRVLVKAYKQN